MKRSDKHRMNLENVDSDGLQKIINTTDDLMKTLITMSSALLAVGVIFNDFVKSPLVRAIIILLFFIALVAAFLGVLPINVRYDIEDASELREQQLSNFRRKRRHLWTSAGIMALGFILVICDLLVDVYTSAGIK